MPVGNPQPGPAPDNAQDRPLPWFRRPARPVRSNRVLGLLIDAFAGFATLDGRLDPDEADLILDLLRSAFPEADHSWLARRVQRAVRQPKPLSNIAADLRDVIEDSQTMAVALQLYTLVDAVGRTERSRSTFEVFMRRLGHPEHARQILAEMSGEANEPPIGFERITFGHDPDKDILLPAAAVEHAFHVYRSGDLILVRNTGTATLWMRGHSLEPQNFLRIRARQQLIVPGWTLTCEDLSFFLNVALTGNPSTIFLVATEQGWLSERARSRQSHIRIRFGLGAEVEALKPTSTIVAGFSTLEPGRPVRCAHHHELQSETGLTASLDVLRRRAAEAGGRFRLAADQRDFRVSNDPAVLDRGDLLLSPGHAPRVVLRIRFDPTRRQGDVSIREAEGTILADGIPVRHTAPLREGSLIRLSRTQALRCRFSEGILDEERYLIESLRVEDLIHYFGPGNRALDNISFEVRRGEMMAIIGPSGSGKSTLLSILAGQLAPSRGHVRFNDTSLYAHREELIRLIANMPQEEALNPQLTVREHLRHALTIRRASLSSAEVDRRADAILAELGLQNIARRRVGSPEAKTLSGGERGRLNLGLDLGSPAEVFLFDEPISGLSSKDSEHVAETLHALAREKIVIASLHRPGANVLALCDKVLLLDTGGRVAFFGSPPAMIDYFQDACAELGLAHPSIETNAPLGADFVFDILEIPLSQIGASQTAASMRRFPPSFWQERFESRSLIQTLGDALPPSRLDSPPSPVPPPSRVDLAKLRRHVQSNFRIFRTQLSRAFLSKIRNRGTIYATLIESPLLATLIGMTLRASPEGPYSFDTALHLPAYLFLSATVAMFLGLTNSATEILRDRPVLRRERNYRRQPLLYVAAKFVALSSVAAVQCFIYTIVGHELLDIYGTLWSHWLWMTLTACTGTSLALLVSALVRTERAALTAVPLLLVPQMLLAGALVPFREMNRGLFENAGIERERGGIPVPARIMPLRFAYEGMLVTQAIRNPFDVQRIRIQRRVDDFKNLPPPLDAANHERFEVLKTALRALSAAGASSPREAADLAEQIRILARSGTLLELESLPLWPTAPETRPISGFFVNERIDLLVREAETFRTDYRNQALNRRTDIFLAEKKPLGARDVPTIHYDAAILGIVNLAAGLSTALALFIQARRTR